MRGQGSGVCLKTENRKPLGAAKAWGTVREGGLGVHMILFSGSKGLTCVRDSGMWLLSASVAAKEQPGYPQPLRPLLSSEEREEKGRGEEVGGSRGGRKGRGEVEREDMEGGRGGEREGRGSGRGMQCEHEACQ